MVNSSYGSLPGCSFFLFFFRVNQWNSDYNKLVTATTRRLGPDSDITQCHGLLISKPWHNNTHRQHRKRCHFDTLLIVFPTLQDIPWDRSVRTPRTFTSAWKASCWNSSVGWNRETIFFPAAYTVYMNLLIPSTRFSFNLLIGQIVCPINLNFPQMSLNSAKRDCTRYRKRNLTFLDHHASA